MIELAKELNVISCVECATVNLSPLYYHTFSSTRGYHHPLPSETSIRQVYMVSTSNISLFESLKNPWISLKLFPETLGGSI